MILYRVCKLDIYMRIYYSKREHLRIYTYTMAYKNCNDESDYENVIQLIQKMVDIYNSEIQLNPFT